MGVIPLVVVGGVPAEMIRRDIHGGGDVVAICPEKVPPRPGVVIAKTGRVLPFQGDDVRPHIAGVLIQLPHGLFQIHSIFIIK